MNYIFWGFLIWQSICWLFFCCLTPGMAWLCFKLSTELQVMWTSQNFASIAHIGAEIPPILCYQVFTLASVLEKLLSGKVVAYKSRPITYRLSLSDSDFDSDDSLLSFLTDKRVFIELNGGTAIANIKGLKSSRTLDFIPLYIILSHLDMWLCLG